MPEIAARAHVEALDGMIAEALAEAGLDASTTSTASPPPPGPGLIGGVMVGLTTAKAIALRQRQAADRGQPSRGAMR